MRLFECYDRVVVISLPERTDRRKAMVKKLGPIEFFDAIRPSDRGPFNSIGAHGCYLSHLEVLSHVGSVLILEDDCEFTGDCIVPPRTDIFYGGWLALNDSYVIGSHCMGFSEPAAKLAYSYLSDLIDGKAGPDPQALKAGEANHDTIPSIDGAYVWFRRRYTELTTLFAQVSRQRLSRSDVTPRLLDKIVPLRPIIDVGRSLRGHKIRNGRLKGPERDDREQRQLERAEMVARIFD